MLVKLVPMKTPLLAFAVFGLLAAGCESSSTTGGAPAPTVPEVAKASGKAPATVWPKHVEEAVTDREVAPPALDGPPPVPRAVPRMEVEEDPPGFAARPEEKELPPEKDPPIPEGVKPLNKEKTVFFEKAADNTRRVHILAEVCLREGPLEVFLCKNATKEHEAILHADLDARDVHFALIAAGAKPGTTVKFVPVYKPATGDPIKVSITYYKDGKLQTKPAQSWIQDVRTKKDMPHDWVFAGSRFFKDPGDSAAPPFYCANNGEVICIANFADSMMDLPVMSSKEAAELGYVANTERIPPLKTKVLVTLEPVKKK
jgi:hypothetical protein